MVNYPYTAVYALTKPLLDLPAGTLFVHVDYNRAVSEWGNPAHGALLLAWVNGNCQAGWCGGAFCLPGQYAETGYFDLVCRGTRADVTAPNPLPQDLRNKDCQEIPGDDLAAVFALARQKLNELEEQHA